VDEFDVTLPDGTVQHVTTDTPANSEAEYERLLLFREMTTQQFTDWRVWSLTQLWGSYGLSVNAAAAWMYTTAELTPQ
jgi:hypothetical protein